MTVTDPSTVSGVVSHLVDRRLVRRETSERDARRAEVVLTERGARLLERAPKAPQDELVTALSAMPPRERRTLAKGLLALAGRLGPGEPSFFFEDERKRRRR
jgi:DNA-binding MarR family transcriptional regulator